MRDEIYRTSPALSAIYDEGEGCGIVLDDIRGNYWRVDRESLLILCTLARFGSRSATQLQIYQENPIEANLAALLELGLIEKGVRATPIPNERSLGYIVPSVRQPRHVQQPHQFPPLEKVWEYIVLNIRFQLQLLWSKWAPIRKRRALKTTRSYIESAHQRELVEEILSCMRIAALLPFISKSCIPRALTAFEILRRRGFVPELVIGAYVMPFEPHIWVEWEGMTIDSGRIDFSLDIFIPVEVLNVGL